MKWITYKIAYGENQNILIDKKIGFSEANLIIAETEAYNGSYKIEDDNVPKDINPIPIEIGGTGACTKEQALENLGGVSKEYVDNIGLSENLLVKSGEGTDFIVNDTCEFPLLDMKLFGKTTQLKTTGAQCIPFPENGSATHNGITATFENGKITLSGTSVATVWLAAFTMSLDAGEYTLSSDSIPANVTVYIFSSAEYFSIRSGALVKTKTFSQGNYNFVIEVTAANVTLNSTFQVMLNKGSTALPWEPYTGGKPSPSPEYPQELKSSSRVGNLIPFPYVDGGVSINIKNGISWFVYPNGSIKAQGTAESDSIFMLCNTIQWIKDTDSPFDATSSSVYINGKTFTDCELARSASNNYLRIRIPSGTTIDRIFYPMVVDGKEKIPFRPYNNGQKEVVTTVEGANLLDSRKILKSNINGISIEYLEDEGCFLINGTATQTNVRSQTAVYIPLKKHTLYRITNSYVSGTVTRPSGNEYALTYVAYNRTSTTSANWISCNLNMSDAEISGYSYDATTLTYFWFYIEAGVSFKNYKVRVMIYESNVSLPYQPYKEPQQLITTTPNGLNGLPVSSGGNYTDVNGQQWICDEIDFERGVLIKRTHTITFVGTEPFSQLGSAGDVNAFFYLIDESIKPYVVENEGFSLSSHFETKRIISSTTNVGHQIRKVSTGEQYRVLFRPENASGMTAAQFQAWLKENPTTVTFALATSTEISLSADDMKKFESLTSVEGTTVFRSDANIIVHCAQNNKIFEKVKDVFDRLWKRIEAIESFMIQ